VAVFFCALCFDEECGFVSAEISDGAAVQWRAFSNVWRDHSLQDEPLVENPFDDEVVLEFEGSQYREAVLAEIRRTEGWKVRE